MAEADTVTLGRIGAPKGVRGECRVQSFTRPAESILDFETWWIGTSDGWTPYRLLNSRIQTNAIVVSLEGCVDRDGVAALRHAPIAVPRSALPDPEPGEYYWHDLIDIAVETVDGVDLGRVDHLFETGANDVMVVRGERERLIPWVQGQVIQRIELDAGRMIVDWDPDF